MGGLIFCQMQLCECPRLLNELVLWHHVSHRGSGKEPDDMHKTDSGVEVLSEVCPISKAG
jgi:hypothetical protein